MSDCLWCEKRGEPLAAAVAVFTSACVHEHFREIPVCADHLAKAQGLSARGLWCHVCRNAGEYSHYCPITITGVRRLETCQTERDLSNGGDGNE